MTMTAEVPTTGDLQNQALRAELDRISELPLAEQVSTLATFVADHDLAVHVARHLRNLRIRDLRDDEHLSRQQIADLADVSLATVAACIGGRVKGL